MSVALESLDTWAQEVLADGDTSSARVKDFATYLRQCYGATPFEAIASDEMSIASEKVKRVLAEFPLPELLLGLENASLPVALRHWCLALYIQADSGGDHLSAIKYQIDERDGVQVVYGGAVVARL